MSAFPLKVSKQAQEFLKPGECPLALIFLDDNNSSQLTLRCYHVLLDRYATCSADGRAWMDTKLEEIFLTLKAQLAATVKKS